MINDVDNNQEEIPFAIAMITENGDVNWILSEDISLAQEKMFKKIYAVTVKPSIVLLFFLHLEIFLLGINLFLERIFKRKNND
tara:strand:+ start:509 stop:757 length:249 start_codon:yes stop_codon:yes gene_type:complete